MNQEDINKNNVEAGVLSAINSGKAKMRPKWRFVLQTALTVTAIVIILLIIIYLVSFIIFSLHENGAWFAPDFGFSGWFALFGALPWVLIALTLIFIAILSLLFRNYSLGYHLPLLYSLLGILFLIVGGSLLIGQTSLLGVVFSGGMHEEIPLIGSFYSGFGVENLDNVHHGIIIALTPTGFTIDDLRGKISTAIVDQNTELPYGDDFKVGDEVIVFGERAADGNIHAQGVERLSSGNPIVPMIPVGSTTAQ